MTAPIPGDVRAKIVADYQSGMRQRDVASKYGVGQATVQRIARAAGMRRRSPIKPAIPAAIIEAAVADYLETGDSTKNVAARHSISRESLRRELQHRGQIRPQGTTTKSRARPQAIADFLAGMTIANVAAKHGIATSTVSSWLEQEGVSAEDRDPDKSPREYRGGWVLRGVIKYPAKPIRQRVVA